MDEPGDRYWRVVKPVWDAIRIYDGPEEFLRGFRAVPLEVDHLFAAHWCQSEVCNGGFAQFFANPTGVLAPEALAGFRAIGLEDWATLLDQATGVFGPPSIYPRDQLERLDRLDEILEARPSPFRDIEDRFYGWLHEQDSRWERAADDYAGRLEG